MLNKALSLGYNTIINYVVLNSTYLGSSKYGNTLILSDNGVEAT